MEITQLFDPYLSVSLFACNVGWMPLCDGEKGSQSLENPQRQFGLCLAPCQSMSRHLELLIHNFRAGFVRLGEWCFLTVQTFAVCVLTLSCESINANRTNFPKNISCVAMLGQMQLDAMAMQRALLAQWKTV